MKKRSSCLQSKTMLKLQEIKNDGKLVKSFECHQKSKLLENRYYSNSWSFCCIWFSFFLMHCKTSKITWGTKIQTFNFDTIWTNFWRKCPTPKTLPNFNACRGVGTTGEQGHMPSQYFEQLVPVPPQYFQQTFGPTKCVPLQYLTPSYAPVQLNLVFAHFLGIAKSSLLPGFSLRIGSFHYYKWVGKQKMFINTRLFLEIYNSSLILWAGWYNSYYRPEA